MRRIRSTLTFRDLIYWAAALLVLKTLGVTALSYTDYFPPNFRVEFLKGRENYFIGAYQAAFYTHIISGPACLLLCTVLHSQSFLRRWPRTHRRLGRVFVGLLSVFMVPSGLYMAQYAMSGKPAVISFTILSIVTEVCALLGWRAAVKRDFSGHARWMRRCYILLFSAVVLRVMGGLSSLFEWTDSYPYASWLSWVLPLLVLEFTDWAIQSSRRRR